MGSRHSKMHGGDAITIISDGCHTQATFLKSTGAHVEVVVTNPDGSSQLQTVAHALCKLGWYDAHGSRITTTVDELMHNSLLSVQVHPTPCPCGRPPRNDHHEMTKSLVPAGTDGRLLHPLLPVGQWHAGGL